MNEVYIKMPERVAIELLEAKIIENEQLKAELFDLKAKLQKPWTTEGLVERLTNDLEAARKEILILKKDVHLYKSSCEDLETEVEEAKTQRDLARREVLAWLTTNTPAGAVDQIRNERNWDYLRGSTE